MKDPKTIANIPEPSGDEFFFGTFERMLDGYRRVIIFKEAFGSGIFDLTEETISSDDITGKLSFDPDMCRLFCEALVGMGMLEKDGEGYRNTPLSSLYFVRSSPYYQKENVGLTMKRLSQWDSLGDVLRDGPAVVPPEEMFNEAWITAIGEGAVSGSVGSVLRFIEERIDMDSLHSMIDVGGGHALYTIGFCARHPNIKGTVFDRGKIVDVARKNIEEYGSGAEVIRGDYTVDPLGGPYDLVFSSFNGSCSTRDMAEKMAGAVAEGGYMVARRHLPSRGKDPIANLGWNLTVFDISMKGKPRHSAHSADNDGFDEEVCRLGLEIVCKEDFDETSYMTVYRRR